MKIEQSTDDVHKRIHASLQRIEAEMGVRILYACESGSRAWGMASEDSDYDVRFLYVRPVEAYLKLDMPRDVIELPITDDLDINGWDIFKALRLLRKSNPPLLEWLFSPIVYVEKSPGIARLREIVPQYYSPVAMFYHYRHMAFGNYRQYIEQKSEVPLKKYLYVLRPIIALLFLEQHKALPHTHMQRTLAAIEIGQDVREHIEALIERKKAGGELGLGLPNPVLNAFIAKHLARWNEPDFTWSSKQDATPELNEALAAILAERAGD